MYKKGDLIKSNLTSSKTGAAARGMSLAEVYDASKDRLVVKVLTHVNPAYIGKLFTYSGEPDYFELVERVVPEHLQIVLTRDGDTVRAVELDRGVPVRTAKVKCDSRDTFRVRTAVDLLMDKLGYPEPATEGDTEKKVVEKEPKPVKKGDFVRVVKLHGDTRDAGLRVGDIVEVLKLSSVRGNICVRTPHNCSAYFRPEGVEGPFTWLNEGKYEKVDV